jgi:hypothetical protein
MVRGGRGGLHPRRDSHTRVDILATSRQVRVEVAGLVAFHDEEIDLVIDDQLQEWPVTKFSRRSRTTRSE